jgi:hypothetical protein
VSSVERGRRQVRRLDVLVEVARELRVDLPDLLGRPVLEEAGGGHEDVAGIRAVLLAPGRLAGVMCTSGRFRDGPDPVVTSRHVEQVWFAYQGGRLDRVLAALPSLIETAGGLEDDAGPGRRGWAVSARVHHLAATALSKVGEGDLAWVAADRAMRSAGAAARRQDRATATELLTRAQRAATRLGRDANYWQSGFGPTNVALHRLAVALDLGDVGFVVDRGPGLAIAGVPPERVAAGLVDVGRALALVARDDEALMSLLGAEEVAPELVRRSPAVRQAVTALGRRAPVTGRGSSSALGGLAQRCRVRV